MEKMRKQMWKRQKAIVVTLIAILCATLTHAQQSMLVYSAPVDDDFEIDKPLAEDQRAMVRDIMRTAIGILRDGQSYDPSNVDFGRSVQIWRHAKAGMSYYYENRLLHSSLVTLEERYSARDSGVDRDEIVTVPESVSIFLSPRIAGIPGAEIKSTLQLEDYWVDSHGHRVRENENGYRRPEAPNVQRFAYRSKELPSSKFPVDVQFSYLNPVDGSSPPLLESITIRRVEATSARGEHKQPCVDEMQANDNGI
ncbi:hypothetical protein [Burkholderia sp. BE17]|uniref:hypothetical protein n=1 Tax=Burkholderia sp. BE17 TaxID=2656644 RepID=UPI00128DC416|nr:hypothetical protein [Burkholderia sp. BE17]MPV65618.1 hypothetical protein [Burkholderia sp. BE17]